EIRAKERAVRHVQTLRRGDAQNLERALCTLSVPQAHVDPRELVQHVAELGRRAIDVAVGLRRIEVIFRLVEEATNGHPREIDDVTVRLAVRGVLRHFVELLDGSGEALRGNRRTAAGWRGAG